VDLHDLFTIISKNENKLKFNTEQIGIVDFFPTNKFKVTYDPREIKENKLIPEKYFNRMDTLRWEVKSQVIQKNNLMILDLLASNHWKRPVYFAMTMGPESYIGLDKYFHLEGVAYRLLPVVAKSQDGQPGEINTDAMYENLMNKFQNGNMQDPGVYMDENNLRMSMNLRNAFGRLANCLILEGKKDSARRVLDRCMEAMPGNTIPMNFFVVPIAEGYYKVGEKEKADQIAEKLYTLINDDLVYLFSFSDDDLKEADLELQQDITTMQRLSMVTKDNNREQLAQKSERSLEKYYNLYMTRVYQPRQ
jgi:hypothetical protein